MFTITPYKIKYKPTTTEKGIQAVLKKYQQTLSEPSWGNKNEGMGIYLTREASSVYYERLWSEGSLADCLYNNRVTPHQKSTITLEDVEYSFNSSRIFSEWIQFEDGPMLCFKSGRFSYADDMDIKNLTQAASTFYNKNIDLNSIDNSQIEIKGSTIMHSLKEAGVSPAPSHIIAMLTEKYCKEQHKA